ncbi:hypothetical protein MWU50_01155 [Flavobacteriaceae bacterium S0862]|nr:hypothetical protein [Flavobacteriaceae bacterium S0862]
MTFKYPICHPEKEKMVVDDIWSISFDKSIKYLERFVNGNNSLIEKLYKK